MPEPASARPLRRSLSALLAGTLAASGAAIILSSAPASATPGPTPVCTASACTVTFGYTGALQQYTVPAGISEVTLATYGAQGGPGFMGNPGGGGGVSRGTLEVPVSRTFSVLVGQAGSAGGGRTYGGGGATGSPGDSATASGGGGSFVFLDSGDLVLAAGGGAGRFNVNQLGGSGAGAGQTGGTGQSLTGSYGPGGGGTQSAGGAGGYGGGYGPFYGVAGSGPAANFAPGDGGNAGQAGLGGGGSGGGGGYYGGGGGAAYTSGGGGSGFAAPAMRSVSAETGTRSGNGLVTLSWTKAASSVALSTTPLGGSTVGDAVTVWASVVADSLTPTGTVSFTDGSTTLCAAVSLDPPGRASCTTSALPAGNRSLVATYSGDDLLAGSSSAPTAYAVGYEPLTIGTTSLPNGIYGQAYSLQLDAGHGLGPYTWAVTGGSLPAGLTLSTSGLLSGTPQAAGTSDPITFTVTDSQDQPFTESWTSGMTIEKVAQEPGFAPSSPQGGNVGGTWQPTTTDGGSGNARVLSVGGGTTDDACSVSDGTVSFDHVGWCEVVATQPGDTNWNEGSTSWLFGIEAKVTDVVVTLSDLSPAHGHGITGSATSTAAGTLQWALDGDDLGTPVDVEPGTPVDAPTLWPADSPLPAGIGHEVSATFVPTDDTVDGAAVGREDFGVGVAEAALELTVTGDQLVASVRNAVDGDHGVPSGDVEFFLDDVSVGTATLVPPAPTVVGFGLLPAPAATATLAEVVPGGASHHVAAVYEGDDNFTGASESTNREDPVMTAAASSARPRSANGWYRTPVTVTFTCTPAGSTLVGGCPAPVVVRNGLGQSVSRTVLAQDGGVATASVSGLSVDLVAPRVRVAGKGRTARCVATDSLSGVAGCTLVRTRSHGRTRLVATAYDRAGNSASTAPPSNSGVAIVGAPLAQGRYVVEAGSTHTVVVWAKQRPRLLSVVPAGTHSSGAGRAFAGGGKGLWQTTVTVPAGATGAWQVGVQTKKGVAVVPLTVQR